MAQPMAHRNRTGSSPSVWLGRLLLMVVPVGLLFTIGEGALWFLEVPRLVDSPAFGPREFMRRCRADEDFIAKHCSRDRFKEPEEAVSVYVFGGSSVQGYPVGETVPFAGHMRRMLNERHPGEYAIHNLGVACRDSIYIRKCATLVRGDTSDVYVIYAGHNDFANFMVPNPRFRVFAEEYPYLFDLQPTLARSRIYSFLSSVIERRTKWAFASRLPEPQRQKSYEVTLETFTNNVTRVIELASDLGIRVLLVTVVSNVTEYPRRQEAWHEVLDPTHEFPHYGDLWRKHFSKGVELFEAEQWEESLHEFKAARDDTMVGRAPGRLNERVRALATRYPNVELVDFEQTLDRVGVKEGHGCNFFGSDNWCDQFHPNARTQEMIARDVVDKLEAMR